MPLPSHWLYQAMAVHRDRDLGAQRQVTVILGLELRNQEKNFTHRPTFTYIP